jgi:hypothetical protein
MAKKKPNIIDDDFDLDNFDDNFNFDIPDPTVKDDRKPIVKVVSGIKEGAMKHARTPGFYKEVMKSSFPASFGNAVDLADEVGESAKNLYDESVKEIKPTMLMARKTIGKLIPPDASFVPKKVQDVLQRWRDEPADDASAALSKEQVREGMLGQTLRDIFEATQASDSQRMATQMGRENLKIGLDHVRSRNELDALNRSAMSLKRLDDYSTTIGLNYQKKSLELQYRLLFATQDVLDFSKQDVLKRNEFLASIAKNTALPEFVKITTKEAGKEIRRRKVFDMYHNALFGVGDQFIQNGIDKMKKSVLDNTRNFMGDLRGGLQDAHTASEMAEGGAMGDVPTAVGEEVGKSAGQGAANWLGKKIYGKVSGSKADKRFGISDKFHTLDDKLTNLPNAMNEFKRDRSSDVQGGLGNSLLSLFKDIMPSMGADKDLSATTSRNLRDPAAFSMKTDRSITEIIPGFLSRIFREIQVLRTGNESLKLTGFSHDRGTFADGGKLARDVIKKIVPEKAVERTQHSLETILELVDPQKQLSEEERTALKKRLLTNSTDRLNASKERLGKADRYEGEAEPVKQRVSAHMSDFLDKATPQQKAAFTRHHHGLSNDMNDPRQHMQDMLESGDIDLLRENGLLIEDGKNVRVNMEELIKRHLAPIAPDPDADGGTHPLKPAPLPSAIRVYNAGKTSLLNKINQGKAAASNVATQAVGMLPASVTNTASTLSAQATQAMGQFGKGVQGYAAQGMGALQAAIPSGVSMPTRQSFTMPKFALPSMPNMPSPEEQKAAMARVAQVTRQGYQQLSTKTADLLHPDTLRAAGVAVKDTAQKVMGQTQGVRDQAAAAAQDFSAKAKAAVQDTRDKIQAAHEAKKLPGQKIIDKVLPMAEQVAARARGPIQQGSIKFSGLLQAGKEKGQQLSEKLRSQETQDALAQTREKIGKGVTSLVTGLGNFLTTGRRAIGDAAQSAKDQFKELQHNRSGAKELASQMGDTLKNKAEVGAEKIRANLSTLGGKGQEFFDLYVGGEKLPRITAAKLAQGLYRLKETGAQITHMGQIKGAVVDENNNVVLAPQELSKIAYYNAQLKSWARLHLRPMGLGDIVNDMLSSAKAGASSLAKSGMDMLASPFKKSQPSDVYVDGEKTPRLYATKMLQGEYFDVQSGKVIQTPQDIRGPVRDANNQTLIAQDELDKLNVYNFSLKRWWPLRLAKSIGGLVVDFYKKIAIPWTKWNLRMLGKATMAVGRGIGRALGFKIKEPPKDVYVAGENTPRLEASKFAKGEYLHRDNGKPITHPDDIAGPIIDRSGNTLIDADDLKNLVVYNTGLSRFSPLRLAKKILLSPFKAIGFLARKAFGGISAAAKAVGRNSKVREVAGDVIDGAKTVGRGAFNVGKAVLGIERQAKAVGYVANENPLIKASAEAKANADRYRTLDRVKSSMGSAIGKVKGLFGPKLGLNQLAALPIGDAAAVKSSSTLDQILATVKGMMPKKKNALKDQYADDFKRMQEAKDKQKSLRDTIADRLKGKSKGEGKGDGKEEKGILASLLDKFGLGEMLEGGGLLSKAGGFLKGAGKLAGKAALPLAAGAAAYGGIKDEANGKKIENAKDIIPDGFWNKLNPFAYAMNGGRFAGNLMNKQYEFTSKLVGGSGSLGSDAYSVFNKDPMKQMDEQDKLRQATGVDAKGKAAPADAADSSENTEKYARLAKKQKEGLEAPLNEDDFFRYSGGVPMPALRRKLELATAKKAGVMFVSSKSVQEMKSADSREKTEAEKKQAEKEAAERQAAAQALAAKQATSAPQPVSTNVAQKVGDAAGGAATMGQQATSGNKLDQPSSPDAEQKPSGGAASTGAPAAGADAGGQAPGSIPAASGPPMEGSNGLQFAVLKGGVNLDGLNPAMRKNFLGMVEEYGQQTGKKVPVNDGARSSEDQARMYQKYGPGRAAKPGTSMHEFGLAVDGDSKTLNEMEQMGLMRKYGFTRPVGREPWHVEPIGTQVDIQGAKRDPGAASNLVLAGLGMGGGGLGTDPSARPYGRSKENSLAIMKASGSEPKTMAATSKDVFSTPSGTVQTGPEGQSKATANAGYGGSASQLGAAVAGQGGSTLKAQASPSTKGSGPAPSYTPGGGGGVDEGEKKPPTAGPVASKVKAPNMYGKAVQGENKLAGGPADPTAKVPTPQGTGAQAMMPTIEGASKLVGIDKNVVAPVIAVESGFNPNARAPAPGTATGLGQFTAETWKAMMSKYASKYGIDPSCPPTDAKANAIMTAQYLKDNGDRLSKNTGMPVGATEAYMGHFLGGGGATTFLKTMQSSPETLACQAMPKAAAANPSIFYDNGRPRTVQEVYTLMDKKLRDKSKAFGIEPPPPGALSAGDRKPAGAGSTSALDSNAGAEQGAVTPKAVPSATSPTMATAGVPAGSSYTPPTASPRPSATAAMASLSGPAMPTATPPAPVQRAAPPTSTLKGGMDASVFAKAEDILAKSLGVQTEIRDAMIKLVDVLPAAIKGANAPAADSSAPASPAPAPKPGPAYDIPKGSVSMKRVIA